VTDFIVYISAQQQMHGSLRERAAEDARRPVSGRRFKRLNLDAVRQRISIALYQLANAVHPVDVPADVPLSAAR
jgi:hypothetical protein